MSVTLRPYQVELVEAIRAEFARHRRVLAVAPTGSGKTATFAYIAGSAAAKGNRVTIVAHRSEIVDQISAALDRLGVRHGRIQPGHAMTDDPLQVAMIQTLARRLSKIQMPQLLVVDEAHHAVAGTWKIVADALAQARILGVTATPRRLDGTGLGAAFDAMVIGPSMADLIRDEFLAAYDYLAPPQKADLSSVKTRMGDFAVDQVADIMDKQAITGDAVSHYRQHLYGRPAIAFCVTVAHAEHVAQQFRDAGYSAASVDGKLDASERRRRIEALGSGGLQVLTSCDLISEGVDVPIVAGAILLRPTKSLGMFLQQVGRCLRPKPDGGRALILDHVGNVHLHGLPDAHRAWTLDHKDKKTAAAPMATCKACFRVFAVGPDWKQGHDSCDDDEGEAITGCLFAASGGIKHQPQQVDGELAPMAVSPDWARGISLTAARGPEWNRLLGLADTIDKLREIAAARGYKPGWAGYIMGTRRGRSAPRQPDADVPFVPPAPVPEPAPVPFSMFDAVMAA